MSQFKITPGQIRAARALIDWSQKELGEKLGVTAASVANIENGKHSLSSNNLEKLFKVFDEAGVEFAEDSGVKLKSRTVEVLEGVEGMKQFFDNVFAYASESSTPDICVSNSDEKYFVTKLGEFAPYHVKRMLKLRCPKLKVLIRESDPNPLAVKYAEYKSVPDDLFSAVPYYIYGDKVGILLLRDGKDKVIVIEDADMADAYRKQFMYIWDKLSSDLDKRQVFYHDQNA